MKGKMALVGLAIVALAQAGCEEKGISPGSHGPCPFCELVPQRIVLNASSPVAASVTHFRRNPLVSISEFDFSDVHLVASGSYNELLIAHRMKTPYDETMAIYNHSAQRWDTIGAGNLGKTRAGAIRRHYVSALGLNPRDYIDESRKMKITASAPSIYSITVTAVQMNAEYEYFPVFKGGAARDVQGLSYHYFDNSLWVLASPTIMKFSMAGQALRTIETSLENLTGLALYNYALYVSEARSLGSPAMNRIHIVDVQTGTAFCTNTVLSDDALSLRGLIMIWNCLGPQGPYALTVRSEGRQSPKTRLALVSIQCREGGTSVFDDYETMEIPEALTAITNRWNTGDLLGADEDNLYLIVNNIPNCPSGITPAEGDCDGPAAFPVSGTRGIAWDGSALWVLNYGPRELGAGSEPVVSKFYLK